MMSASSVSRVVWIAPVLAFVGLLAVVVCTWPATLTPEQAGLVCRDADIGGIDVNYPYEGSVFPPEMVAPHFVWRDSSRLVGLWYVRVEAAGGHAMEFITYEPSWRPSVGDWRRIKELSKQSPAKVTIVGLTRTSSPQPVSSGHVSISTSGDPVGAPVFYREVNLPFADAVRDPSRIRWRFGSVDDATQPPVVLSNLPVCGNCHSFSADGSTFGMDVDYANDKGSYALTEVSKEMTLDDNDIITWSDYKRDEGDETFGLLSRVSPDGRYVVSTVKDKSVFVALPDLAFSQLFFPFRGILCVYDRQARTFKALSGADDPNYVQSNPVWSPDGRYIVFARSKAYRLKKRFDSKKVLLSPDDVSEFLQEGKQFLFDLYRIPFNAGKGGVAEPLEGASNNGMSNYFAKYSPDGRWIVFCRARSYMLLQPDSELYIIPAEGGAARRLACNRSRMNSWHSFSPNGKWLVFSSKANTPYTQLFLTHIGQDGASTPPVLLENFTSADRAANIPEFVNADSHAIARIAEKFLDEYSFIRAAQGLLEHQQYGDALAAAEKALKFNPNSAVAHLQMAVALKGTGRLQEAGDYLAEAVRIDPNYVDAQFNLALAMIWRGELDAARERLMTVLKLDSDHAKANGHLGALLLASGQTDEAVPYLRKAISLDDSYADAHYNLGRAMMRLKHPDEARRCWLKVVQLRPDDAKAHYDLAMLEALRHNLDAAAAHYERAVTVDKTIDTSSSLDRSIAGMYAERRDFAKAALFERRALRLAVAAGDEQGVKVSTKNVELYESLSTSTGGGK